ncbi:MAG: hypothetical protein LBH10_02145 [Burkholderiaceae bacterium]|jgi:hypothetical protein|nr:hypothetical protein [Burkholderiaceae bacterium]
MKRLFYTKAGTLGFVPPPNQRGLPLADGTTAPVAVNGMALFDPVTTGARGDFSLPPNVQGKVLVLTAATEHRDAFPAMDYSADPRALTRSIPNNHAGVGGGYDRQGTAAAALEITGNYLRHSGVPLTPVPPGQRYNPNAPVQQYTEQYATHTAANGDPIGTPQSPVNQGDRVPYADQIWSGNPGQPRPRGNPDKQ